MTETIFTRDGAVHSFDTVDEKGITTDDDGDVEFNWDEIPIVRVDAPSDLEGAFDTERFYKIEGATIARPIKQPYHVGDSVEVYKKPTDELKKAAWSFDNAPFTLGHPNTGMVKDVDDIHGFWKSPRYDSDSERLVEDLYIPETDEAALEFIENNQDVSVGFFNRVYSEYDGDTGSLTDDDVDGFQVDMFGNHIAGVERGRCSSEQGCGLDSLHGNVHTIQSDATTSFLTEEDQKEGDSDMTQKPRESKDQPSGIYTADGTWFAVGPDEHTKESTEYANDAMFPVDSCSDVEDAWGLRGHTDNLTISKETLGNRIERVDEAKDCGVVPNDSEDSATMDLDAVEGYHPWKDCGCDDCDCTEDNNDNMTDDDDFNIPDLSIDALAEKNSQVNELAEQRDQYEDTLESLRDELDLDEDEDEDMTEVISDLKTDRDEYAETVSEVRDAFDLDEDDDLNERVEDIADEWAEYREDKFEARLDELEDLGADREQWDDESLDALDDEIERRKEVLDSVDETSPTGIDTDEEPTEGEETYKGRRRFGRGYGTQ